MNSPIWQADEFKLVESTLTGRILTVNTSETHFLIPPSFDAAAVRNAVIDLLRYCESMPSASFPRRKGRIAFGRFAKVKSRRDFERALDELVIYRRPSADLGQAPDPNTRLVKFDRFSDMLIRLWLLGCIVWPRQMKQNVHSRVLVTQTWGLGNDADGPRRMIADFRAADYGSHNVSSARNRMLWQTMLAIGGAREIGDLTPSALDGRIASINEGRGFASVLLSVMRARYAGRSIPFTIHDYGPFGKEAHRSDDKFLWAVGSDSSLEQWRCLGEVWMAQQTRSRLRKRGGVNSLFDGLIRNPGFPREPLAALKSDFRFDESVFFGRTVEATKQKRVVSEFFEWILTTHCVAEADDGSPYRIPGFRNPITRERRNFNASETVREALPTRYIRILREILVENDFAWPKAFGMQKGRGGDYVHWFDAASGAWIRVWSPVRTYAILLKLQQPLRTFQVRMLNSGEADRERFDRRTNTWCPNDHPLASDSQRGVLKRVYDRRNNRHFVGLYINTNKTADIAKNENERGYVIPWEDRPSIELLSDLREWQERYNPIHELMPWKAIKDIHLWTNVHMDILEERGAESFLFRDAASRSPHEPVTHNRLQRFWNALCAELERRLAALGETGPDGEPFVLVKYRPGSNVDIASAVYDLHSLRVSILTAFAEQGVPIEILMKVAGHCTAIMAIYYQKYSISHITELLNEAQLHRMRDEQTNWEQFIKSKSYEQLEALVAWNDPSGLASLTLGSGASWVRRDHGICPVGCARCHEGGPVISRGDGAAPKHAPVPGGAQNCVCCRFFITGPAFLIGLVAHFNNIGFVFRERSRKYRETQEAFYKLDFERKRAADIGEPFTRLKEWQTVSSGLDQRTRELDDIALTWHACYRLIEKCQLILKCDASAAGTGEFSLVPAGSMRDIEFVMELDDRGEREFELIDQVCQSARWFPSIDSELPNLKRMRNFDAMLQRNGYAAAFVDISEAEALLIGNELAKFMFTQCGRESTIELMNGERTLRSLGLDAENSIAKIVGSALTRTSRQISGEQPIETIQLQ